MEKINDSNSYKLGLITAILSSALWGMLPIYWKQIDVVPADIIIFYRIFLVGVVSFLCSIKFYGFSYIKEVKDNKKMLKKLILAGIIITLNWSTYIWGVNNGYILQTSIGYYIQPLILCFAGILFFKEKKSFYNITAIILALIGIGVVILNYGKIPFVAIILSITFSLYPIVKKGIEVKAIVSLFFETAILMIPSLIVIIYMEYNGIGALAKANLYQYILLLSCGIVTAIPLALFSMATIRIPMITLGITSYISPSLALILGVLLYNEPFNLVTFLSFCVVWVGLGIFTIGEYKKVNNKL